MVKTIYCISGLGADEKVFSNLRLEGYQLKHIPWLRPRKNETISEYALRMSEPIEGPDPVLIGVSFGGMMGIEIAKQKSLNKLFIISSIKSDVEIPNWMKLSGRLGLNKVIPIRPYKITEKIQNDRLGAFTDEEKEMVKAYRNSADPIFVQWAIDQVLNWKNNWNPDYLIHIHGDKDKIFPLRKLKATHVISNGTHLMVYNRASEVGSFIIEELARH